MSLLEHPDAQALLADAVVTPDAGPRLPGPDHRPSCNATCPASTAPSSGPHATLVIRGLLSGLQRKTCEPIAVEAGVHRKPVQNFVGAGKWDDEAVMAELRGHVREELADPDGGPGPRPQRLPQDGDRVVRGGPAVVRPAGQAGQLPARRLPGLRRPRRLRPAGPPAVPARGLGRRPGPPREVPRPRGRRRSRSRGGSPSTCWSGAARTCPTPGSPATTRSAGRPSSAAGCGGTASGTCSTCPATRGSATWSGGGPRGGVPGPGPQAGGAVLPGRRLGGAAAGVAVDPADGPRRRAGAAAGRRDDGAGAGQGGAAGRAGGAAGGDADGRGEAADRLLAEQRRPGGAAGRAGPGPVHTAPDRGGVRGGEGGGRAGAVRGAELGGLAPPHDAVAAGAVVPDPGAAAGRGGKPRR